MSLTIQRPALAVAQSEIVAGLAGRVCEQRRHMNSEHSVNDEDLSRLLQSWRVDTPLPPRFKEGVWRRIERENAPSPSLWQQCWEVFVGRAAGVLRQPVGAATYLLALLIAGAGMGYWSSARFANHTEETWRSAYVQAVNPYSTPPER